MVEDAISFWTDIQRYENMLAADPRSYCFAPLSELYRKLGLLDDAISVAEKGCKMHPDYAGGFIALGNALSDKGIKEQAREALERAVELKPDSPQALKPLGQLCVEAGVIDRARVVLKQLLRQTPEDTESALLLQSIGSGESTSPKDEVIEELEILDDLELIEEVPPAAAEPEQLEVAQAFAELDLAAAPATAAAEVGWGFGPAAESEDFWAIEATDENGGEAPSRPFEEIEELEAIPPVAPQRAAAVPKGGRDPLTTATLAELYVSQGFLDKALGIYQELLQADPGNQSYRFRCAELSDDLRRQQTELRAAQGEPAEAAELRPAAGRVAAPKSAVIEPDRHLQPQQGGAPPELPQTAAPADVEEELLAWLENIRRRKDGV